jgi:hypothetical protein
MKGEGGERLFLRVARSKVVEQLVKKIKRLVLTEDTNW